MALIQVNFFSKSLMRTVPMNVILPVDKLTFPGMPVRENKPYKTLYLLHGVFGNYTDWVCGTNLLRLAEENELAVVMPSGDNMFYVDQPAAHTMYGEFIGEELVELTRKMFPLSDKKEDTFIGGLSMGGYGAIRNGLKYHTTFGYIAGLSPALILDDMDKRTEDSFFLSSRSYAESCFGDLTKLGESDKNPNWLVNKLVTEKVKVPEIYLACGQQDTLLANTVQFYNLLNDLGVKVTYEEGPGGHDWDFWNRYIKNVLDWLPLEKKGLGVNSGNVGI
jgi:S-formylglutathione hydrolase FrmB